MGRRQKPQYELQDDFYETKPSKKDALSVLKSYKLTIKPKNENQKLFLKALNDKEIVLAHGAAGTGKTFLACFDALSQLKNNANIKKIILIKSVTTLKNEELGYLKGTMMDKIYPFIFSYLHNFKKIIGDNLTEMLMTENLIEFMPLAYLRGVSIDSAYIIVDELSNISIDNMHTVLTRLGSDSKIVLLGDLKQIDMKNKKQSSLAFLIQKFSSVEEVGIVAFENSDIVRNPLIKKIEEIFDSLTEEEKKYYDITQI